MFSIASLREKLAKKDYAISPAGAPMQTINLSGMPSATKKQEAKPSKTTTYMGSDNVPTKEHPRSLSFSQRFAAVMPPKKTMAQQVGERSKGNKELEAKWAAQWKEKQERRNRRNASAKAVAMLNRDTAITR